MSGGNVVPSITQAEHIGPEATGDNIEAKRVAGYGWTGTAWQRTAAGLPAHDYIGVTQDTAADTYEFKTGGSAGTTVATLTITYTDSGKTTIQSIART